MANAARESAFVPTIKCSSCGQQVEISMMGEHLCTGGADSIDNFVPFNKGIHEKISVIPPVDTAMANRNYSRQPLTPISLSSGSRSVSPNTPGARRSIGRADEYFNPQIANEDQNSSQPGRSGPYGGFTDAAMDSASLAMSPEKQAPSLPSPRMDFIAAGPFGSEQGSSPPVRTHRGFPPRISSREIEQPSTSSSSGRNMGGITGPPKIPRKNGYGGFGPPQRGTNESPGQQRRADERAGFAGPSLAESFPIQGRSLEIPLRTPSAAGPGSDRYDRHRTPPTEMNEGMGPIRSRAPPPRTSLVRPPISGSNVSNINLADEFGAMNPYHSLSASPSSSSSQGSSSHAISMASSRSSVSRPATSARQESPNLSKLDELMSGIHSSMEELKPRELLPPSTEPRHAPDHDMGREPAARQARYDPAIQGGRPAWPDSPPPPPSGRPQAERQDPAIQEEPRSGSPTSSSSTRASHGDQPAGSRRHGPVQGHKGKCKWCGQAITGKSVYSADGRLSGRYHKACFVCTVCRGAFQTAEFYVHDDRPYCKQHYHEVNGSLCGSCRDGIEGQYLEDERTTKHHVNCFRCGDCNVVLRDCYFEVDGRAYCEKDAWRRMQPEPYRRPPSASSQRGGSKSVAPPGGRPGMRGPPLAGPAPGMLMGNGRVGLPVGVGPGRGFGPPTAMLRMEKRRTRFGMM